MDFSMVCVLFHLVSTLFLIEELNNVWNPFRFAYTHSSLHCSTSVFTAGGVSFPPHVCFRHVFSTCAMQSKRTKSSSAFFMFAPLSVVHTASHHSWSCIPKDSNPCWMCCRIFSPETNIIFV